MLLQHCGYCTNRKQDSNGIQALVGDVDTMFQVQALQARQRRQHLQALVGDVAAITQVQALQARQRRQRLQALVGDVAAKGQGWTPPPPTQGT